MQPSPMTNSPNLSPTAFWDVDRQTLDYEANARFVIEKVRNYGCRTSGNCP